MVKVIRGYDSFCITASRGIVDCNGREIKGSLPLMQRLIMGE